MALGIINDLTLDEDLALNDDDVSALSASVSSAIAALSLTTLSTGYHQVATQADIASGGGVVTDYRLTSDYDLATGVETDFMIGADTIFLFATDDPEIVVGRVGSGGSADAGGDVAFIIALHETVDSGVVTQVDLWMEMFSPMTHNGLDVIDALDTLDLDGLLNLTSSFQTTDTSTFKDFSKVPSGQDAFALIGSTENGSVDLLCTGFRGSTVGTVNVSTTGLGSFSQAVDKGESLRFDIVTGGVFTKADSSTEVHNEGNIDFGAHEMAVAASFQLVQVNPNHKAASVSVFAFDSPDDFEGAGFNQHAIDNAGTHIVIDVADVRILNASNVDVTASWQLNIQADGDGVKIFNLPDDYTVKFTTDDQFDRFVVTNTSALSNRSFDLGNISVTTMTTGTDSESVELGSHIIVEDDGPTVTLAAEANPLIMVDESNLGTDDDANFAAMFAVNYGADGSGSVAYDLGLHATDHDSGLVDIATGDAVMLTLESGVIYGRNAVDDVVFTITVDGDGNVTLEQMRAVVHADGSDPNDTAGLAAADLVTLTATAVDGEAVGDHGSATRDIGDAFVFYDDGPAFGTVPGTTVDIAALVDPANGNESFPADPGADGGHVTIYGWADLNSIGLTATLSGDGTVLTYGDGVTNFYQLTVGDDGYDFDVLATLTAPPEDLNFGGIPSGGPQETLLVPTMSNSYNVLFNGLLFTGNSALGQQANQSFFNPFNLPGSPADDLNPDNVGFGVKNGQASQINQNEGFFFTTDSGSEQQSLTFDVAGIGNINKINMEVWLYDDLGNLVDYHVDVVDGLRQGNQHAVIADAGANIAGTDHDAAGESFHTAYVRFFFDQANSNSGVRIIDFASTVAVDAPDRLIDFQLRNTDLDGDYINSNIFTVNIDNVAYTDLPQHYSDLLF